MRCYDHPDTEAVGICKNCHKGICKDCSVDLVDGIACKNCVEKVKVLNNLVNRTSKTYRISAGLQRGMSIVFGIMAIGIIYLGITSQDNGFGIFLIVIGIACLLAGILTFNTSRKMKKNNIDKND